MISQRLSAAFARPLVKSYNDYFIPFIAEKAVRFFQILSLLSIKGQLDSKYCSLLGMFFIEDRLAMPNCKLSRPEFTINISAEIPLRMADNPPPSPKNKSHFLCLNATRKQRIQICSSHTHAKFHTHAKIAFSQAVEHAYAFGLSTSKNLNGFNSLLIPGATDDHTDRALPFLQQRTPSHYSPLSFSFGGMSELQVQRPTKASIGRCCFGLESYLALTPAN